MLSLSILASTSHFSKRYTRETCAKTILSNTTKTNFILLVGLLLLSSNTSIAATKIFNHTVDQSFSGSQSPDDAYMAAITRAKFEVLELAGTYLESLTVVENFTLTKDEVTALAGGVLTTEVLKKENYATDKTFGILLSTRIEVNTDILKMRMDKLQNDNTLLHKYSEIQDREKELLEKIRQLEQAARNLPDAAPRPDTFSNKFSIRLFSWSTWLPSVFLVNSLHQHYRRFCQTDLPGFNPHASGKPIHPPVNLYKFSAISAALTATQWLEKAIALWSNGKFSDPASAVDYLSQAIALDGENPRTFNNRAVAYLNMGKLPEAEDDLTTALRQNPNFADAHINMGSLHYRRGDYHKAIASYTLALENQPDYFEAMLNRGMASRKLFNFEDAFEDFRRAMLIAPAKFNKSNADAGSLVELNDIDKMCSKSQTACRMGLCRSLDFLRQRGFCVMEKDQ